jgi:hypothetical protein
MPEALSVFVANPALVAIPVLLQAASMMMGAEPINGT